MAFCRLCRRNLDDFIGEESFLQYCKYLQDLKSGKEERQKERKLKNKRRYRKRQSMKKF